MEKVREFITRHPWLWTCLCFVVLGFPQWLASVWSLWSNEPLLVVLQRKYVTMTIPEFSPYWITIPLGISMFVYLIYELRRIKTHGQQSLRPHSILPASITMDPPGPIVRRLTEWMGLRRLQEQQSRPSSLNAAWVYHNRRIASLRIEFIDNDATYKYVGPIEGHGISRGHVQIYRVAVHNTTDKDIEGVQVWLTQIHPMPSELMGHIPLPLHVTHEQVNLNAVTLSADEKRLIDVVSFFDKFWHCNIRVEHTSTTARQEIYEGDNGYEIELTARGKGVKPFSRKFRIGTKNISGGNKELDMVSVAMSDEEQFQEGFNGESASL